MDSSSTLFGFGKEQKLVRVSESQWCQCILRSCALFYGICLVVLCFVIIGEEKQCCKIQVATWPPLPAERVSEFFWISRSGWAYGSSSWRWNIGNDWNQKRWGAFNMTRWDGAFQEAYWFDSIVSQGSGGDCESPAWSSQKLAGGGLQASADLHTVPICTGSWLPEAPAEPGEAFGGSGLSQPWGQSPGGAWVGWEKMCKWPGGSCFSLCLMYFGDQHLSRWALFGCTLIKLSSLFGGHAWPHIPHISRLRKRSTLMKRPCCGCRAARWRCKRLLPLLPPWKRVRPRQTFGSFCDLMMCMLGCSCCVDHHRSFSTLYLWPILQFLAIPVFFHLLILMMQGNSCRPGWNWRSSRWSVHVWQAGLGQNEGQRVWRPHLWARFCQEENARPTALEFIGIF